MKDSVTSRSVLNPGARPDSRRSDGTRNVRQELLQAVELLLGGRSVADLMINDICREAGVSRPTFYAHFDSKFAAVGALAELRLEEMFDALWRSTTLAGPESEALWTAQWLKMVDWWRQNRLVLTAAGQAWRAERGWPEVWTRKTAIWRHYIERMREDGQASPGFDASALAGLIVAMVENAFYLRFSGADDLFPDDERFAQTLSRTCLRMIFGEMPAS